MFRAAHHKVELRVQRPPDEGELADGGAPDTLSAGSHGTAAAPAPCSGGGRSDMSLGRSTGSEGPLLDSVPRMTRALLEIAAEAARGVETDYFRFLESKQGDAYISRLLVKRVLIGTKSDVQFERPLTGLSDVPISMLFALNEDAADPTEYASGW